MPFSVYAPGKLVLIGEYAVLHGAPAVVAAVDRYLEVEIAPRNEGSRLSMPHLDLAGLPIDDSRENLSVADDRMSPPELKQVRCVIGIIDCFQRMVDFGRTLPPPMDLTVDARAMYADRGVKLGLGSSAALTVAMIAGLYAHARGLRPQREILFKHALTVHRHLQEGVGSGIDVAASIYGGFTIFHRPDEGIDAQPRIQPAAWPADLFLGAVWTGKPASTTRLLSDLENFSRAKGEYFRIKIDQLSGVARQGVRALKHQDASGFIAAVDSYYRLLSHLSARSRVPIIIPEDEHLAALAHAHGGVYKPSGAGGGDVGIVFADTPRKMNAIIRTISEAGYQTLDLQWGVEGVRI